MRSKWDRKRSFKAYCSTLKIIDKIAEDWGTTNCRLNVIRGLKLERVTLDEQFTDKITSSIFRAS